MHEPWATLGIAPTEDALAVKRAYAARLKSARPDDDAEAYQRLRQHYEWALHLVHSGMALEQDDEVAVETEPEPEEELDEAPPAPIVAVNDLPREPIAADDDGSESDDTQFGIPIQHGALLVEQICTQLERDFAAGRSDAVLLAWPRYAAALDDLPLAWRGYASQRFAQFVERHLDVSAALLETMAEYFGWGADYRVDHALGAGLAQAVQERMLRLGARRIRDPAVLAQYATPLSIGKLVAQGRSFAALWLAALAPQDFRERLRQTPPAMLRALGLGDANEPLMLDEPGNLPGILGGAAALRLLMFALVLIVVMHATRDAPLASAIGGGLLAAIGTMAATLCAVVFRVWRDGDGRVTVPLVRRGLIVALASSAFVLVPASPLFTSLVAGYGAFLGWMMLWDRSAAWRSGVVPAWGVLIVLIARWLPEGWNLAHAIAAATVWTLLAQLALMRWGSVVLQIYRRPTLLLPTVAWRWVLLAVFAKGVLALLAIALVVALPLTWLVVTALHGVGFAIGAITLATLLTWIDPGDAGIPDIVWFVLAPGALALVQWVGTRSVRLRWFRPAQ